MRAKRLGQRLLAKALHPRRREEFRFVDFTSFDRLSADAKLTDALVLAYQTIFGDPTGWAEEYTRDEILMKLAAELSGQAILRLCLNRSGLVVGFCWAQVLDVDEIASAIATIKYYQSIGAPEVKAPLRQRFGAERVIYLHDLGIDKRYRGRIPLTRLIYPVLDGLAKRSGLRSVLFWSIADTNISRLAKRALFQRILALDEIRFYSGDLFASKTRPSDVALRVWKIHRRVRNKAARAKSVIQFAYGAKTKQRGRSHP